MDHRSQVLGWILSIVASFLTLLAGIGVALTPDGLALIEFKDGLSVTSSLFENWNASDASPCSWGGINCTVNGNVQSISLRAQVLMLEGNISSSLGRLKSLQELTLDNNMLSGSIPPELGNISSLIILSLYGNFQLSGRIPPQLGNCSNLEFLALSVNMLFGTIPESLANLKNLTTVYLGSNNLTGEIPLAFAALPNLQVFDIGNNSLTGSIPPVMYKNLNLISFGVEFNKFTGNITTALEGLSKLPAIQLIDLGQNSFTGTLPPLLGNSTTLISLELTNSTVTGEIPHELGNMVSLKNLHLGSNNLTGSIPSSLGNLVNLESLYLNNNNLIGSIPVNLASLIKMTNIYFSFNGLFGPIPTKMSKMTALKSFYIQNNSMSGPIPKDFGRFMPNLTFFLISGTNTSYSGTLPNGLCQGGKLEKLIIGGNKFHGPIPSSLVSCKSLINVVISKNQFTSIPDRFGSNSSLQELSAYRNQLTGHLPVKLGANSQLSNLDLSENNFIGSISILEFSQLAQNLSILNLSKNKLTGEIPTDMAMCKLLFWVDLSYNSFTGTIPRALANLTRLETLHLQSNNLSMMDPSIFSSWTATLRNLQLAENPWNAPIAIEIGSLKILKNLNLSYGGLMGPIPSALGQLAQLEVLDLSHNNLMGEIPSELGELMISLVWVNISYNNLTGPLPPTWVKFFYKDPDSFRGNPGLCLAYNTSTKVCMSTTLANPSGKITLSVEVIMSIVVGVALALVIFVAFFLWWHGHAKTSTKPISTVDNMIVKNLTNVPLPFTFEDIMAATENLSDGYIIGQGGHGVVYKVMLASGALFAVKKIESLDLTTTLIHKSFWIEIETVGNAKHRNLVRMLGFMKWGEVGLLIYDYVSNGDLHSALHNKDQGCDLDLTWNVRLHIAEGVAHGLAYLHHDYDPPIVHRDIKSSNVLLDKDFEAHISDFGLAKVLLATNTMLPRFQQQWMSTPNVSGTFGYIAPEVGYGIVVTPKLDVYSYGVLLLELLTGRQPTSTSIGESWHLVAWVKENVLQNKGEMSEVVLDPLLLNSANLEAKDEMLVVQRIALLCTKENPTNRPTMRDVANLLKNISLKMETKNKNGNNERRESTSIY